jgi:hypothetical protein
MVAPGSAFAQFLIEYFKLQHGACNPAYKQPLGEARLGKLAEQLEFGIAQEPALARSVC